jgi:hypothetical protein
MDSAKKDLLVIAKKQQLSETAFKQEIAFLTKVLYSEQNTHSFYLATQVIDINRFKIIQKPHLIQRLLKNNGNKPFIFICNKN